MENRCLACLMPADDDICPHCGHDRRTDQTAQSDFLRPGILLSSRYFIGLPLDRNGEGVTYLAFDETEQVKVRIREFFPDTLCHRESDRENVKVNMGCEPAFKALMTDFAELSKQIIDISGNAALLRAKSMFAANGTIYTVYEDVAGITLTKYLRNNVSELSWEETEQMFLPLLYLVKQLNTNGIVHRGISPENILVTPRKELKLKGLCTSAVRAVNSEIPAELFGGYAAPEQHQRSVSHGEWTDVYALSAVLYKVLTGTMPPRADVRQMDDDIMNPRVLVPSLPENVANAVMRGLAFHKNERICYVKDLISALYASAPAPQSVIRPVNLSPEHMPEPEKKKFKMPLWLMGSLIALGVLLVLYFLIYFAIFGGRGNSRSSSISSNPSSSSDIGSSSSNSSQESSSEISSAVTKMLVDNFVGKNYEDITTQDFYKDKYTLLPPIEEFHDTALIGEILDQSVEAGTEAEMGVEIELTVSKGKRLITLPPLVDNEGVPITPEEYSDFLRENGITPKIETTTSTTVPSGQIVRLSHDPLLVVDRATVSTITIYVAK